MVGIYINHYLVLPLSQQRVPKTRIEEKSQISFCKWKTNSHGKKMLPSLSFEYSLSSVIVRVSVILKRTRWSVTVTLVHQQFFSEVHLPGRSHPTNYWYSWVQTIYLVELLFFRISSAVLKVRTQPQNKSQNLALAVKGYRDRLKTQTSVWISLIQRNIDRRTLLQSTALKSKVW